MDLFIVLIFISFIAYCIINYKYLNVHHFYEPPCILIFIIIYYYFQRIVFLRLTDDLYYNNNQIEYIYGLLYVFVFILIFNYTYSVSYKLISNYDFKIRKYNLDVGYKYFFYIVGLISVFLFVQVIEDGYYWGINYNVNGNQLFFAKYLGLISVFYFSYKIFNKKNLIDISMNIIFIIFFIYLFFLIGEKKNLLFIFTSFLILFSYYYYKINFIIFNIIIFFLLMLFIFFVGPVFTIYRELVIHGLSLNFENILLVFNDYYVDKNNNLFQRLNRLSGLDLLAALFIEGEVFNDHVKNTYNKFFISIIPAFIYPEKYQLINAGEITNMSLNGRRYYSDGIFSPIVESYYNLKLIGMIIIPIITATIFSVIFKFINLLKNNEFLYLMSTYIFFKNFIIFESEIGILLSSFVKDSLIFIILTVMLFFSSSFFQWRKV